MFSAPVAAAIRSGVVEPTIGWIFSGGLHARLKLLQRSAHDPDRALSDPFAVKVEAAARVEGAGGDETSAPLLK